MDNTYTTYVPYVFCCPVCRNVHETKRDMAECLVSYEGDPAPVECVDQMEDFLK